MAQEVVVSSTAFFLAPGVQVNALRALIQEHMDNYQVHVSEAPQPDGQVRYALYTDQIEVGASFETRLKRLAEAMGPLLADGAHITVRADTMGDDRDSVIHCGPNPQQLVADWKKSEAAQAVRDAMEILKDKPEALALMREQLLGDKDWVRVSDVHLVATISGGVLQGVTGTHSVAVTLVDFDCEGTDPGELVLLDGGELADGGQQDVTIDPAWVRHVEVAFAEQSARVVAQERPRA